MSTNPYAALGVKNTASQDDIRSAFRNLAKKYHPDKNPGNKKAEETFKKISAAYELIGTQADREQFDASARAYEQPTASAHSAQKPHRSAPPEQPPQEAVFDSLWDFVLQLFPTHTVHSSPSYKQAGQVSEPKSVFQFTDELNEAGWLAFGAVFYLVAAFTLPLVPQASEYFWPNAENKVAIYVIAPIICMVMSGAITILSKDLLVFSLIAAFLASSSYNASIENILAVLYLCSFALAGGLILDGYARSGGSQIITDYDWDEEANALHAIGAFIVFMLSALTQLAMSLVGTIS